MALISSLESNGLKMASGRESMMGYVVFYIQWCTDMDVDVCRAREGDVCGQLG